MHVHHISFHLQALFLGQGPSFQHSKVVEPFDSIELYNLMAGTFFRFVHHIRHPKYIMQSSEREPLSLNRGLLILSVRGPPLES